MGLTTSEANKVSLDEKLQFLQTKVLKPCTYHRKSCVMYCSIPSCQKCPYLCQDCLRENIHQHQEGIYNHNDFLKAIVTLIEVRKTQQNRSMQASVVNQTQDEDAIYKEHIKLMEQVDALQRQIKSLLTEYRSKLQTSIDRLGKRTSMTVNNKNPSYINFYRNPNILACKLSSQQDDKFLLQLKSLLRSSKKTVTSINQQQYFAQLKNQFGNVKSKIRDLLNVTNLVSFVKKNTLSFLPVNPVLKKTFILPAECPLKMSLAGGAVNITTSKDLYNVQAISKEVRKMYAQTVFISNPRVKGDQFIGIVAPTKIIAYDGKILNQFNLLSKICCATVLKSRRKLYGLLGQEQGTFSVIDLEQNKAVFSYRCSDQPITFIQICQINSTIICAGKRTPLSLFRYKSKYSTGEDNSQYEFQFSLQMNLTMVPQGELQLMRINNNELYLFGPCRNMAVFDLMLNVEIIRTEYIKKCGAFTEAQFVTIRQLEYMVTLNEGEDVVNLWYIDKTKRTLRVDQLLKDKNERKIVSIACTRGELWVIRDAQKNVDVFGFD